MENHLLVVFRLFSPKMGKPGKAVVKKATSACNKDAKTVKKERAPNFTAAEEKALIRLVLDRKNVIECAQSNLETTASKIAAWQAVVLEFNAQFVNIVFFSV